MQITELGLKHKHPTKYKLPPPKKKETAATVILLL